MPKTKVLHVVGTMNRGGSESWLMHVLRNIAQNRFHFTFCTLGNEKGAFNDEIRSFGADIVSCPLNVGWRKFVARFMSILKENRYDVAHNHMLLFSGWLLKAESKAGIPIRIAHSHNTRDGRVSTIKRRLYRDLMRRYIHKYATHGIGCSAMAGEYLFGKKYMQRAGYFVLPCAIDTVPFATRGERGKLCNDLKISREVKVIGHVGSFTYQKNHLFLLRVVQAILRKKSDVHIVLVGDGPLRLEMEALARKLGISEHVTFTGFREDVPVLMTTLFELFLLPSRYEGLPVVLMETQCAGLPSLISDVITRETTVIEELINWHSLDASAESWAEHATEILNQAPYEQDKALKVIESSKFSIHSNVHFLTQLYSNTMKFYQ